MQKLEHAEENDRDRMSRISGVRVGWTRCNRSREDDDARFELSRGRAEGPLKGNHAYNVHYR
jgi:hypothetical protein